MAPESPRLLVWIRPRTGLREEVARRLPDVPFALADDTPPPPVDRVEAVLLGAVDRGGLRWSPSDYPRLRFVQRIFAGVDDVPFDRIPSAVQVAGNVGAYAPFVSEHAVALALASVRQIVGGEAAVRAGRLRPAPRLGTLWRETAVILGYGAIGRAIAGRLAGFEARVVGLNRSGAAAPGAEGMFPASRLREAVAAGGIVFDARPLTRLTRGSIGAAELAAMRPDAVFVNVGRGATVDEQALYDHLVAHPDFRAAFDVWWEEKFGSSELHSRFPFGDLPNFLGSPHWAGIAPPVEQYALGRALENLERFFRGEPPLHVVDRSEYAGPARP